MPGALTGRRPRGGGAVPEPARASFLEILELIAQAPVELRNTIAGITRPGALADLAAAYLDASAAEKQDILETIALIPRLDKISTLTGHRLQVLRISHEIGAQTPGVPNPSANVGAAARAAGHHPARAG